MRVIGPVCPICGRRNCWRRITAYWRTVIELFPYREKRIPVARFQCRATCRTFSLLPIWLAPYHRYTIASMLIGLLLAATCQPDGIQSLFAVAEKQLDPDSRANGYLLGQWLLLCLTGLRRAHAELARWAKLGGIIQGHNPGAYLGELCAYCRALGIRGPPLHNQVYALDAVLRRHAGTTRRFLFGTPFQERRDRAAP